jgi:hypothetical protein
MTPPKRLAAKRAIHTGSAGKRSAMNTSGVTRLAGCSLPGFLAVSVAAEKPITKELIQTVRLSATIRQPREVRII